MTLNLFRPVLGAAACCALFAPFSASVVWAADGQANVRSQESGADKDIVVTGRSLAPSIGAAAYDVVMIGRDQLQRVPSDRLEDVLRDVVGVAQFRRSDARSAHPTSQGVTLRGLGGNASSRALVLLDGVPLADPFGGWINWASLSPRQLGSVNVTRGGGTGAFGAGALAGTIELETAGREEIPVFDAGVAYGERNSLILDASGKADVFGGYATLSGRVDRGDGFVPILAGQRGPVDRAAPYEQWSVRARHVAPVGDQLELQVSLGVSRDKRERGVAFSSNSSDATDASVRLVGTGRWAWEALLYAQDRSFESAFAAVSADRSAVSQSLDQFDTPASGFGGKLEVRPPLGEGRELRLGVDYRQAEGETNERFTFVNGSPTRLRFAGGASDTIGLFAEYSLALNERLILTGGGRVDRWRLTDGALRERSIATGQVLRDESGPTREEWQALGRVGASYKVAPGFSLRTAAYQSYRLPTLNELYRPFRVGADATAANLALEPEKLVGVEFGVDFTSGDVFRLDANVFLNTIDDAIANVTVAKLPGNVCQGVGIVAGACRQRRNIQGLESRGLELNAGYSRGDWRVTSSYAYVESKMKSDGIAVALNGLRPAQTPEQQFSLSTEWSPSGGPALALSGRFVSSQFEDDLNRRRLSSAVVFDGFARFPLSDGLSVELRGENLTDTLIEASVTADGVIERAAPRTVWFALRYRR